MIITLMCRGQPNSQPIVTKPPANKARPSAFVSFNYGPAYKQYARHPMQSILYTHTYVLYSALKRTLSSFTSVSSIRSSCVPNRLPTSKTTLLKSFLWPFELSTFHTSPVQGFANVVVSFNIHVVRSKLTVLKFLLALKLINLKPPLSCSLPHFNFQRPAAEDAIPLFPSSTNQSACWRPNFANLTV